MVEDITPSPVLKAEGTINGICLFVCLFIYLLDFYPAHLDQGLLCICLYKERGAILSFATGTEMSWACTEGDHLLLCQPQYPFSYSLCHTHIF